jgi:thiol:disulfide interchange protein
MKAWVRLLGMGFCFGLACRMGHVQAQEMYTKPTEAYAASAVSGRPILLIFSGSDWCAPCIRFEREVLQDSAFRAFAAKSLTLLVADFPQRKKQPTDLLAAYEALAERYNPQGAFPHLVLLAREGAEGKVLSYSYQKAALFVRQLRQELP